MPQFDFLSYSNQLFWLILFFLIIYFINSKYFFLKLISIAKIKKYYLNFLKESSQTSHKFNINITQKLKNLIKTFFNTYYIVYDDNKDIYYILKKKNSKKQ